jgi:hypothetical protein
MLDEPGASEIVGEESKRWFARTLVQSQMDHAESPARRVIGIR